MSRPVQALHGGGFWIGVEAMLSQHFREKLKIHLAAFMARKLSPAQENYYIGNWKLALEESQNWLEGTAHLVTVSTDHSIFEYLRTTKCLNPHQAMGTSFNFTLSYWPGSKNPKALSHQHQGSLWTLFPRIHHSTHSNANGSHVLY